MAEDPILTGEPKGERSPRLSVTIPTRPTNLLKELQGRRRCPLRGSCAMQPRGTFQMSIPYSGRFGMFKSSAASHTFCEFFAGSGMVRAG